MKSIYCTHCFSLLAGSLTVYLAERAAIVYDDIYAMATQSFWHLHPEELVVLQMVLHAVPESSTLAQILVHLPHTSSEGSWHLMIATLTAGKTPSHRHSYSTECLRHGLEELSCLCQT